MNNISSHSITCIAPETRDGLIERISRANAGDACQLLQEATPAETKKIIASATYLFFFDLIKLAHKEKHFDLAISIFSLLKELPEDRLSSILLSTDENDQVFLLLLTIFDDDNWKIFLLELFQGISEEQLFTFLNLKDQNGTCLLASLPTYAFPEINLAIIKQLSRLPCDRLPTLFMTQDERGNTPLHRLAMYASRDEEKFALIELIIRIPNQQLLEISLMQNAGGTTIFHYLVKTISYDVQMRVLSLLSCFPEDQLPDLLLLQNRNKQTLLSSLKALYGKSGTHLPLIQLVNCLPKDRIPEILTFRDQIGLTPLHHLARNFTDNADTAQSRKIANLLQHTPLDPAIRSHKDETPRDIAIANGNWGIAGIFEELEKANVAAALYAAVDATLNAGNS